MARNVQLVLAAALALTACSRSQSEPAADTAGTPASPMPESTTITIPDSASADSTGAMAPKSGAAKSDSAAPVTLRDSVIQPKFRLGKDGKLVPIEQKRP